MLQEKTARPRENSFLFLDLQELGAVIFFILLIHAAMLLVTKEESWIISLFAKVFRLIEKLQKYCLLT